MPEQIRFVDTAWLDANFPCMVGCPVHTEAGRYVGLIEEGRFREAYTAEQQKVMAERFGAFLPKMGYVV